VQSERFELSTPTTSR